ncbi:hypothetical protein MTO96_035437 [Rhipicephalus appendiculatus]
MGSPDRRDVDAVHDKRGSSECRVGGEMRGRGERKWSVELGGRTDADAAASCTVYVACHRLLLPLFALASGRSGYRVMDGSVWHRERAGGMRMPGQESEESWGNMRAALRYVAETRTL